MSIVKIQGNASGTGEFTLASPNGNTNRTITLPDATGTLDRTNRAGNVLQVVDSGPAASANYSTTSTSFQTTGWSATVTPTSATSKILLFFNAQVYKGTTDTYIGITLYRNGSNVVSTGNNYWFLNRLLTGSNVQVMAHYYDSPASTSAQTYTIYFKSWDGNIVYIGDQGYGVPRLLLMEIAA
jgi:hypothetical protein